MLVTQTLLFIWLSPQTLCGQTGCSTFTKYRAHTLYLHASRRFLYHLHGPQRTSSTARCFVFWAYQRRRGPVENGQDHGRLRMDRDGKQGNFPAWRVTTAAISLPLPSLLAQIVAV